MEKLLSMPLKRNFTPNTLGCYGLNQITVPPQKKTKLSYLKQVWDNLKQG